MASEMSANAKKFSEEVENLVYSKDISYMEAILEWCEDTGIEQSIAGEFVKKNPAILAKIQEEAENLHFIPKTTRLF